MNSRERENPVDWVCLDRETGASVFISRQCWHDAIREGAVQLGTSPERCECVRACEREKIEPDPADDVTHSEGSERLGSAGLTRARVREKGSARA